MVRADDQIVKVASSGAGNMHRNFLPGNADAANNPAISAPKKPTGCVTGFFDGARTASAQGGLQWNNQCKPGGREGTIGVDLQRRCIKQFFRFGSGYLRHPAPAPFAAYNAR